VAGLGRGVSGLREGDRVALLSGAAFAEFDVAPAEGAVPIPPELEGPFPGEALGLAANVVRRCDIRQGDTVAVVGVGFHGLVALKLAALAGARTLAFGRRESARALARRFGADEALDLASHAAAVARARELTGGRLCDVVIEAAGAPVTLDLASELVRERGRLAVAGRREEGPRAVDLELWSWRGLDVVNALDERDPEARRAGIETAAAVVASRELDLAPLFSAFPLARIAEAFQTMEERPAGIVKAVVLA
jgi:threonine dehydrogenase-like Zn-dependent dehydrogenase